MADRLNPLIEHQKVFIIDAHGHEMNPDVRKRLYDDPKYDLHFHKITNPISINGKKECKAEIRIPINNLDRDISVEISDNDEDTIPRKLKKEIKEALKDRNTRDEFVKELGKVMSTYPSLKNNREKTENALRRFAHAFGINTIPSKDSWFTHIDQDKNNVSMFSLISANYERYNFLICDNFIFTEQAEPSRKFILTLTGLAQSGKTETIKLVFQLLIERYPQHAIIIEEGFGNRDVKALLFINGAKVGIDSQGDPNSRQMRSIDEFVNLGCDIILSASRTRGMTTRSIKKYEQSYNILWFQKEKAKEQTNYFSTNMDLALQLAQRIEVLSLNAFEEL